MDRLELNAHIERLIESKGADAEAREVLAEFGWAMKEGSPIQMLGTIVRPGDTVSGQTPEHGSVQVEDGREQRKEFERGVVEERVGYYKLSRQKDWLVISHFWKAGPGTESETELAPEWALALDKAGRPEWFGERGRKPVFRIPLGRRFLFDVSRNVYLESWGPQPGRQHKGALLVAITLNV
jgi:hypothetical protein